MACRGRIRLGALEVEVGISSAGLVAATSRPPRNSKRATACRPTHRPRRSRPSDARCNPANVPRSPPGRPRHRHDDRCVGDRVRDRGRGRGDLRTRARGPARPSSRTRSRGHSSPARGAYASGNCIRESKRLPGSSIFLGQVGIMSARPRSADQTNERTLQ